MKGSHVPMTPFPMPLTTPPETSMNLVMAGQMSSRNGFELDDDDDEGDCVQACDGKFAE